MHAWLKKLRYDPLGPLLNSGDPAVVYFTRRDLLGEAVPGINTLWDLKPARMILKRQLPSGGWLYPDRKKDYALVETFKQIRYLIEMYGMDRRQPDLQAACEFILSHQSAEGDIRGILANQQAAYYSGALLALLIKAGYGEDPRIERGLQWLLKVRQNDGGWVELPGLLGIPHLSVSARDQLVSDPYLETAHCYAPEQPFSIPGTGMAIRPFCLHPDYCRQPETLRAANLLKQSFFKKNHYNTYQHPDNWIRFQFPFWWNNLLSALDSLAGTGLKADDPDIRRGLDWLRDHQLPSGLWNTSYSGLHKQSAQPPTPGLQRWISLSAGRILRSFETD